MQAAQESLLTNIVQLFFRNETRPYNYFNDKDLCKYYG